MPASVPSPESFQSRAQTDEQGAGGCDAAPSPSSFDSDQYDMLMRCSRAKDVAEWNDWRKSNPGVEIHLAGADLQSQHLAAVNLNGARLEGADLTAANLARARLNNASLQGAKMSQARLEGASFFSARMRDVDLSSAYMEGVNLNNAILEGADLSGARLQEAKLNAAHLERALLAGAHLERAAATSACFEGANLYGAHLDEAGLRGADFRGAQMHHAHLRNATFQDGDLTGAVADHADLEGTYLRGARLDGASLRYAVVDGKTLLAECSVDRGTDFTGVGLKSARMETDLRSRLEGNVRRFKWKRWYESRYPPLTWLVRGFWGISDYGQSTMRIVGSFFVFGLVFSLVYCIPGIVANLHDVAKVTPSGEVVRVTLPAGMVVLRAVYFSVVTMTTLGFGDMYAAPMSVPGHTLLILQVVLGYVLLAALVTRLAILFQES